MDSLSESRYTYIVVLLLLTACNALLAPNMVKPRPHPLATKDGQRVLF